LLNYPDIPAPEIGTGKTAEIARGVAWLRMPIPGDLGAINIWVLEDQDGWTIVDTGLRLPETADAWGAAVSGELSGGQLRRVLVTHMHPDHSGMAGWLCRHHDAELWMSRLEFFMLRTLAADTGTEAPSSALAFYREAGWQDDAVKHYQARFGEFGKMVYPLPSSFVALSEGDVVTTDAGNWQVLIGRGHSAEQSLLYNAELGLLISGDQVLPSISSNVSIYPQEPRADPMTAWIESLAEIREKVPDDVLVLPSHGLPFQGLHARIEQLIAGHETAMDRLLPVLETPRRAVDVFPVLFKRAIDQAHVMMATGESLAHLACLQQRGLVTSECDAQGVRWWKRCGKAEGKR
jgi:glyoxylase-like metal-dependent hydrolase (beta-lactamase superfamily II)